MNKKICVVTGTRSEYGLLKPVMSAIDRHKRLTLQLVVTGSHLNDIFGGTIKEIERDGFNIDDKVKLSLDDDTNIGMSIVLGEVIIKLTKTFQELKPSLVLILGDRVEVFGAALAAFYMNIPVAQMHAGDKSIGGHLDDSARHAISKLASINFAASKQSYERLIRMGEEKWRVHHVGAPGLDSILNQKFMTRGELFSKLNLENRETIILLFHSITTEVGESIKRIKSIMDAMKKVDKQVIAIFPNADAGGRRMLRLIEETSDEFDHIHIFKNIDHDIFLNIMKHAEVMVGNSSSGIIEAPSFKLPVVNVGKRQEGRERADNIIDVGYSSEDILKAIEKALYDKEFRTRVDRCVSPYGDGKTAEKVVNILDKIEITPKLLQKKITY